MATTIMISETDSSSDQQHICQSYIRTHFQSCMLGGQ
jgi:hypothetical protein